VNLSGYFGRMHNNLSLDKFHPIHLRYFSYNTATDNFRILIDKGDLKAIKGPELQDSSRLLLNYFLIGVTLPDDKFWVNLRPDSENNIIDAELAQTDVGKIFLEADLQLKKDTARFTSPETAEGRAYWNKLYKKAEELFGYDNITIPTLTRPWIVPDEIIIRENSDSAYICKATLKVLLEQDHLKGSAVYNFKDPRLKALNEYSSEVIRETILPKLTQEVNVSQRYAPLRQVFYSLILARWFKTRFSGKAGLYSNLINTGNLNNLTSKENWSKLTYFKEYQKSFKGGEYNVKEPVSTPFGQTIRSYFSGGLAFGAENLVVPTKALVQAPGGAKAGVFTGNRDLANIVASREGAVLLSANAADGKITSSSPAGDNLDWPSGEDLQEMYDWLAESERLSSDTRLALAGADNAAEVNGILAEHKRRSNELEQKRLRNIRGGSSPVRGDVKLQATAKDLIGQIGPFDVIQPFFREIPPGTYALGPDEGRAYGTLITRKNPVFEPLNTELYAREKANKALIDAINQLSGKGVPQSMIKYLLARASLEVVNTSYSGNPKENDHATITYTFKPVLASSPADDSTRDLADLFFNKGGETDKAKYERLKYKPVESMTDKDWAEYERLRREVGLIPDYIPEDSSSSPLSAQPTQGLGGIDFRAMNILVQPMGSFSGLNFNLPKVSNLSSVDLEKEFNEIQNMVEKGIIPSGERIKYFIAASVQAKGIGSRQDDMILCILDIFRLEEETLSESDPQTKEALVILDSNKFVL